MNSLKYFFNVFCVMFAVTNITYAIFNIFIGTDVNFIDGTFQSIGLSFIFTSIMFILDYLSNYIYILNSKYYIVINYLLLLGTIVTWAIYFNWGDWSNNFYSLVFILIFTIIYFIVYFMLDLNYKKEDEYLSKRLKNYQKKIKN